MDLTMIIENSLSDTIFTDMASDHVFIYESSQIYGSSQYYAEGELGNKFST